MFQMHLKHGVGEEICRMHGTHCIKKCHILNMEQTGGLYFALDYKYAKGPKYTVGDGEIL